jgi:hypothetical protein
MNKTVGYFGNGVLPGGLAKPIMMTRAEICNRAIGAGSIPTFT